VLALFRPQPQIFWGRAVTNSFSHFFQGEGHISMDGMNTAESHRIERSVRPSNQVKAQASVLNTGLDVQRFRLLAQTKPRTKAGQVRQVWPELKVALAAGHRLKDIRTWLSEIGIEIGYARLSDYVGQLKRRDAVPSPARVISETRNSVAPRQKTTVSHRSARSGAGSDPLSNLQEHERRPALFDFNPEPDAKKLI
jgi:hypothetical protein